MGFNEPEAAHRIVSRTKYAAAFRRISRSCRSSAFSLRNRANSARPTGSSAPGSRSRSASFTTPSLIPNDDATSARDRSELRYSATASRRNSSGYFCGRPFRVSFLQGITPQNRVSKKPGQLQIADEGVSPLVDTEGGPFSQGRVAGDHGLQRADRCRHVRDPAMATAQTAVAHAEYAPWGSGASSWNTRPHTDDRCSDSLWHSARANSRSPVRSGVRTRPEGPRCRRTGSRHRAPPARRADVVEHRRDDPVGVARSIAQDRWPVEGDGGQTGTYVQQLGPQCLVYPVGAGGHGDHQVEVEARARGHGQRPRHGTFPVWCARAGACRDTLRGRLP
jgi:hypothetical protein